MESIETSDKKANAKGAWPHLTIMKNEAAILLAFLCNGCIFYMPQMVDEEVELTVHEGALSDLEECRLVACDVPRHLFLSAEFPIYGASLVAEGIWRNDIAALPITSYWMQGDVPPEHEENYLRAFRLVEKRLGVQKMNASTAQGIRTLRQELKPLSHDLWIDNIIEDAAEKGQQISKEQLEEHLRRCDYPLLVPNLLAPFHFPIDAESRMQAWSESVIAVNAFRKTPEMKVLHISQEMKTIKYLRTDWRLLLYWVQEPEERLFRMRDDSGKEIAVCRIHYPHGFFMQNNGFRTGAFIHSYLLSCLFETIKQSGNRAVRVSGVLHCNMKDWTCELERTQCGYRGWTLEVPELGRGKLHAEEREENF